MRAMKDSGVEWIGEIPADWGLRKVKHYYKMQSGFTPDSKNQDFYDIENGYDWVNISDFSSKKTINSTKNKISKLYIDKYCPAFIPKGSLMYSFKLSVGQVAFAGKDIYTNEAIVGFLNDKSINLKFLYYSSFMIIENSNENIYGAKILNQQLIKNAHIIFPPLLIQQRIANYLDDKCLKIDSIIEREEQIIEKLKAYRQSLITEAVTKGLNPDVPMKVSDIEWIGEIPEHWEVIKAKYIYRKIGDVDHYMPESIESGIPYLMTGDLKESVSKVEFLNCKQISLDDYNKLSKKIKPDLGDIIFARYATIGTLSYVDIQGDFIVSYACVIIKPKKELLDGKYLFYYFKSFAFIEDIKRYINANTQGNLGLDSLNRVKIVMPNILEQKEIANYLDKKCSKIDSIINKKQALIDKLSQYKKSLIYEVVTGKKEV